MNKELIKQLEEEANNYESKIIRIRRIIAEIEELDSPKQCLNKKSAEKPQKKRKYTKRNKREKDKERKGKVWIPEIIDFLKKEGPNNDKIQMCRILKDKFGIKVNENALANVYYRFEIGCRRKGKKENSKKSSNPLKSESKKGKWTDEMFKFMKDSDLGKDDMTKEINRKFGTNFSVNAVYIQMRHRNLHKKRPRRMRHKCEECKEEEWIAWSKGRQLCKRCFDIETKGLIATRNREKKGEYEEDEDAPDLGGEE